MKRCFSIVAVILSLIADTLVCLGFSGESNRGSDQFEIHTDSLPAQVADCYSEIDGPATSDLALNVCLDDGQSMKRDRIHNCRLVPSEISLLFELAS